MANTFINKSFVNNKYIDISLICLPLLCEVFLLQLSDNPIMGIVFLISCIITTTTVVFRLKECKTTIIPRIFIAYFCFLVIGLSLVFSQGICTVTPVDLLLIVIGTLYLFAININEYKRLQNLSNNKLIKVEMLLLFIVCCFWSLVISSILTPIFIVVYFFSFYCFVNKKSRKVFRYLGLYLIGFIILVSPILCFLIWILTSAYNKMGIALMIIGINAFICSLRFYYNIAKDF